MNMNINMNSAHEHAHVLLPAIQCVGLDLPDKKPKMQASNRAVHMHYICQVHFVS